MKENEYELCPRIFAALLAAAISVSSACIAGPKNESATFNFNIKPSTHAGKLQLALWSTSGSRRHMTGSSFLATDLPGLDLAAFAQAGRHPIAFAYVREPGRLDCSGYGGSSVASGQCAFTQDAAFANFLAARGIGRPSVEQAYELTMTDATRDLVDALASYRYPTPEIEKLAELAALGVTRTYISGLAAIGNAPKSLDDLTQFAALDVTPAYIDALRRSGYSGLSSDEIAQLKAVGVTPELIGSLAAAGYPRLTADEIEQMAALDITPAFIGSFARIGYANLPVGTLVELKALDVTPEYVRSLRARGISARSAEQLVEYKSLGFGDNRSNRR